MAQDPISASLELSIPAQVMPQQNGWTLDAIHYFTLSGTMDRPFLYYYPNPDQ